MDTVKDRRTVEGRHGPVADRAAGERILRLKDLVGQLAPHATGISVRARQRLPLAYQGNETLYVVSKGCLFEYGSWAGRRRVVLALLFPGDVFRTSCAPPGGSGGLSATMSAEVLRMRWSGVESLAAGRDHLWRDLTDGLAETMSRAALHAAMLSTLSGEERVATLFLELALRLGTDTVGGITFDIPLSRNDMADYLALNADTLSRIISRLKARGIISQPARRQGVVRDYQALWQATPFAGHLKALISGERTVAAKERVATR